MLQQAQKDLDIAGKEIEKMAATSLFSEFEEAWQNFLSRIERVWEFVDRKLRKENGYQQFTKNYKRLREKDQLLIFLKQARNAETHAVAGTIDVPFQLMVHDKTGRAFHIDEIEVTMVNGVLSIHIKTPDKHEGFDIKTLPSCPRLVKFKNRGVSYDAPDKHLGNSVKNSHPVIVAKLGHQFYQEFVRKAHIFMSNEN